MQSIQIIGGNGMLGKAVMRAAHRNGVPITSRYSVDITNVQPRNIEAPTVINCATILGRGKDPVLFDAVNAKGPQKLAEACNTYGARLIQVSTDALYKSPGWHTEDDLPEPDDVYSRSKLGGEVTFEPHLTVRVAFIGFGQHGVIAELVRGPGPIKASNALLWSGHCVDTIGELLIALARRPDVTGLIHVPGEGMSRWDLAQRVIRLLELDPTIVVQDDSTVADRRLASLRWDLLRLPSPPSFDDQLRVLFNSPACQRYLQYLAEEKV